MTDTSTDGAWTKLGLIAGGGELPREILSALGGRPVLVVRLNGFAEDDFADVEKVEHSVGEVGAIVKSLKAAGCDAICFAGYVTRPDFKTLRLDAGGLKLLPRVLAARAQG